MPHCKAMLPCRSSLHVRGLGSLAARLAVCLQAACLRALWVMRPCGLWPTCRLPPVSPQTASGRGKVGLRASRRPGAVLEAGQHWGKERTTYCGAGRAEHALIHSQSAERKVHKSS